MNGQFQDINGNKLRTDANIFKRFERLSKMDASYLEDKIGFGWSGDYYEYIKNNFSYFFYFLKLNLI